MLLFNRIKLSKLKCFIDIVAKFFTNIWIKIVKKKYNFFRFVQKSTNLEYLASTS